MADQADANLEKWEVHKTIGEVRGIEVMVVSRFGRDEYHVHLLGTSDGVYEDEQAHFGKLGIAKAAILGEAIFAALQRAECTWFTKTEGSSAND
jgi:hypothetical protein